MRYALTAAAALLTACSSPEPVVVRPDIPDRLTECAAGPGSLPDTITPRQLFARDYKWQAAHAECRDRLKAVVGIIEGRDPVAESVMLR